MNWQDDPALTHLRDDAPYVACSRCGRKLYGGNVWRGYTTTRDVAGSTCEMSQPDGSKCDGVFELPEPPASSRTTP